MLSSYAKRSVAIASVVWAKDIMFMYTEHVCSALGRVASLAKLSMGVNYEMIAFEIDMRLRSEAVNNKQKIITYESASAYTTTINY